MNPLLLTTVFFGGILAAVLGVILYRWGSISLSKIRTATESIEKTRQATDQLLVLLQEQQAVGERFMAELAGKQAQAREADRNERTVVMPDAGHGERTYMIEELMKGGRSREEAEALADSGIEGWGLFR